MDRLPYKVCKPYYDALGLQFEEKYDRELKRWFGNNAQYEVIKGSERFPVIIGGERGGKSFSTAAILLPHILLLPEIRRDRFYNTDGSLKYNPKKERRNQPDFVIFGPNYAEPKVEFELLEGWLRELDAIQECTKPQKDKWKIVTRDGVVVMTWSTEISMSIRGIDLEGAAAVECGAMDYDAIERIQGRIGAKRGFCLYNGTMENAKPWYVKWSLEGKRENRFNIKTYSLPSWANRHEFPGGREDPEIMRWESFYGGPESITFLTRVAAEAQPPRERVLKEFNIEHIKEMEIPFGPDGKPECEIELFIDPGYLPSAYSVLWVAIIDMPDGSKLFYIFDEFYDQEVETTQMIAKIKAHKFWKYVKKDGITIDVSAKRHADGNEPALEIYKKTTGKFPYTHYWHENKLIERLRLSALKNQVIINPSVHGLIAELGLGDNPKFPEMHPWKYHTDGSGIIINDKPIDRWNHACKALGYGMLRHLGLVDRQGEMPKSWNRIKNPRMPKKERKTYFNRKN